MTGDAKEPVVFAGRYEVGEILGSGGFGTTYLARDLARFGTQCVVKELLPSRQGNEVARRLFEREARLLCDLSHPQIPTMHGFFEADQHFFLVQDFVQGETLQARLVRETRLSEAVTRDIVLQLLDVLEFLHQRVPPVIHRDIKPANIILASDGRVVLIDFGAVREAVGGDDKHTTIGTAGYTPSEQMIGRATTASDCYALGATALQMISGLHPVEWHDHKTGRLDWRGHVTCTPQFESFLAGMLAPLQERISNATDAREALLGGETRLGEPSGAAADARSAGAVPLNAARSGAPAGPASSAQASSAPAAAAPALAAPPAAAARASERIVAEAPRSRRLWVAVPVLAVVAAAAVWAMRGDKATSAASPATGSDGAVAAVVADSSCTEPATLSRRTESEFDLHVLCPADWTTRYVPTIRTTRVAAPHDSTQVWAALWRPAAAGEGVVAFAERWRATMAPVLGGALTLEQEAKPDADLARYRVTRSAQGVMLTGSLQVERTSVGGNAFMVWSLLLGATEQSRPMALQVLGSIDYVDPAAAAR